MNDSYVKAHAAGKAIEPGPTSASVVGTHLTRLVVRPDGTVGMGRVANRWVNWRRWLRPARIVMTHVAFAAACCVPVGYWAHQRGLDRNPGRVLSTDLGQMLERDINCLLESQER